MAHEHGPHVCYCPGCNYETTVDAYVQCNTLTCPVCGARMRAKETGEYRESRLSNGARASSVATVTTDSLSCPVCSYPIPAPSYVGQQVKCAYCGSISEAIAQDGVTIPTPVFVGLIAFGLGVVLGPSLIASTQAGSEWLARKARARLA